MDVHHSDMGLVGVLLLEQLGNGVELDVGSAFVDGTDLAITPELLGKTLTDKAHATHPLNSEAGNAAGNLGSVELGHGGVTDKVLASLLLAGSVVDEGAGGGNLGVALGNLVLHALELTNKGAELLAVVPDVLNGIFKGAKGKTGHLGGNTDAALVEEGDGVLVAVAALAKQVLLGDDDVVKVEDAGGGGADAELLLLLGNGEAGGALFDNKGSDALVALGRVEVGKDDEDLGLHGVGDPHLAARDFEAVGGLGGLCGHGEGVGSGDGLGKAEGADGVGGELGQPLLLEGLGAVLDKGGVAEGVVHVDHDGDGGVGAGQLLNADDGRGEGHAGAAVLLGDLDAHEALLKQLLDNDGVHGLGLVHLARAGEHHFAGKLGHGLGHGRLRLGKVSDGRGRDLGDVNGCGRHAGCGGGEGAAA